MRRLVPWLVTGILAVGAGAGGVVGGLGLPRRSPAAWASRLLATTRAAGTAQVEVTTVTTSPSPLLVNALTQSGPVDFRTGSFALGFSVGPRTSHLAVEQIVIGRHQYLVTKGGLHHTFATTLPQRSVGPLGSVSAVGSLGALERPDRVWQVRRLGTARIGAIAKRDGRFVLTPI